MRDLRESGRAALDSLAAQPTRSLLTGLAMAIGVASVIAVVSLLEGLGASVQKQFEGLGANVLSVKGETSFEERLRGKINRLTTKDVEEIRFRIAGITNVTPLVTLTGANSRTVRNGSEASTPLIFGTTASIREVQILATASGRFLSPLDDQGRRRVCVLGEKVRADLRLPADPSGSFVQIGGEWFRVVGVMEPRGEILGFQQDNNVYIPYETALSLIGYESKADLQVYFRVEDGSGMELVEGKLRRLLRSLHGLKASDKDDFKVENAQQVLRTVRGVLNTITAVLGGVIGISLLVGGIGIMNIMLVSVGERTREIGICKALGAQRADIMLQFLLEAACIALAGGLVGVAVGHGAAVAISKIVPSVPAVGFSWAVATLTMAFSAAVGILFGVAPATRAANLDPIEALRRE